MLWQNGSVGCRLPECSFFQTAIAPICELDVTGLPPIYPVMPPSGGAQRDVGVNQIAISQTNFESAPVVLRADVATLGLGREPVVAAVVDESGKEVERQTLTATDDGKPLGFRFQFRPERRGVSFYRVEAFAAADEASRRRDGQEESSTEQTLANNSRLVVVDQGGGPYRVLYVSGRPNWEFKFLRRAIEEDKDVELIGLIRIARRKPKFDFRQAGSQNRNSLFNGFDHPDSETAEQQDQPVLVRLGTGRCRAARRLSQGGRRAVPVSRGHHRRSRGILFHAGPAGAVAKFREPARRRVVDAGRPRFVCRRQVRPNARSASCCRSI